MPTILRIGSLRFHFYFDEGNEPPHIHVRNAGNECRFWLDPVALARNRGVSYLVLTCGKSNDLFLSINKP